MALTGALAGCAPEHQPERTDPVRIDMPMAGKTLVIPRMLFDQSNLERRKPDEDWFRLQMIWPLAPMPVGEQQGAPSIRTFVITARDHRRGSESSFVGDVGAFYLHSNAQAYDVKDVVDPGLGAPLKVYAGSARSKTPASVLTYRASDGEIVSATCIQGLWGCLAHRQWKGLSTDYHFDESLRMDLVEIDRRVVALFESFDEATATSKQLR